MASLPQGVMGIPNLPDYTGAIEQSRYWPGTKIDNVLRSSDRAIKSSRTNSIGRSGLSLQMRLIDSSVFSLFLR
jgi:hypothetical protein